MIFEGFGKCDQTLYRGFDTSSHDQSKLKTKEETEIKIAKLYVEIMITSLF